MSKIGLYEIELSDVIRGEDTIESAFVAYEAAILQAWDGGPLPDRRDIFRAGWEAAFAELYMALKRAGFDEKTKASEE